ncbi:hypothetical protein TNCV_1525161 [Trichonephila clavipes]|nr:hypothetical protein TNCV_1525161 [Trichonephila clavipes]
MGQDSVLILLLLLHAPHALNKELWNGVSFLLTAGFTWSSLEAHLQHNGRQLHLPWNVDDLAVQLEQIWQRITQETIKVLYHSLPRRVAACIQARGELTPY